jgi:hypothetical protein
VRQAIPLRRDEHASWGTDDKGSNLLHFLPNVILTVSMEAKEAIVIGGDDGVSGDQSFAS